VESRYATFYYTITNIMSHLVPFPHYCSSLITCSLKTGVPHFNALVRGESVNSILQNVTAMNQKRCSKYRCQAYFDIMNCVGVNRECDGRTDRHSRSKCRALLYVELHCHCYRPRLFWIAA